MEWERDWKFSPKLMRGWHFLINGLKGFGEKDKFSHGIRFPWVFVEERYITLPLNRSEGKEAKFF